MNPLCPNCLNEMSKTASSRNMFRCEPCREIIQFFDVWQDRDTKPSRDVKRPIDQAQAPRAASASRPGILLQPVRAAPASDRPA